MAGAGLAPCGLTLVAGLLHDRRDLGVGDEALPALRIPVEDHPDPVVFVGIAEDVRTLGPVLPSASRRPWSRRSSGSGRSPRTSSLPGSSLSSSVCSRRRSSTPMVRRVCAPAARAASGERPMPRANEVVLERPERRRGAAADAGLLVDVLDVVPDRLGRDAEVVGDPLVGLAAHEHQEDLQLALGQPGGQLARSLPARGGRRRRAPRRRPPGRAAPPWPRASAPPRPPARRAPAGTAAPRAWPRSSRRRRGCGPPGRAPAHACRGGSRSRRAARGVSRPGSRSGRAPATGRRRARCSGGGVARAPTRRTRAARASPRSSSTRRRGRGRARARRAGRA